MKTIDTTLFFANAAMIVIAWVLMLVSFVWCMRSRFRYQLWELRDSMLDDAIARRSPLSLPARDQISSVDFAIRHARNFTLTKLMLVPKETAGIVKSRVEEVRKSFEELPPDDQDRLRDYSLRFRRILVFRLCTASPLGWGVFAYAFVCACAEGVRQRFSEEAIPLLKKFVKQIVQPYTRPELLKQFETYQQSSHAKEEPLASFAA